MLFTQTRTVASNGEVYVQALGFHIWVAELELLLGQVKGSKANIEPVAALELLQVSFLPLFA